MEPRVTKCQFSNGVMNLSLIGQQSHEEINTALELFFIRKFIAFIYKPTGQNK